MFQNDENAVPKQQQMKQLSSSSALKPKKGLSLKPMNGGNGNGNANGGIMTFPKTPSASSSTSSGKNNTRRRALGDISNRKGGSHNHAHSTKSKGKGGALGLGLGGLTIHNDNLKPGSMSMMKNKKSLSTKKSTKKKKKNVTFDQQIYQDALDNSNGNGKALQSKNKMPLESRSMKATVHQTTKPSSLKISNGAKDVEDIEMLSGRSLQQEHERLNNERRRQQEEEEERLQIDLLIGGIEEFDDEKYRKLQEEEEYNELSRQVDEGFGKAIEDLYKYEEVDDSQFKVFEDELYADCDLADSMVDDTDNDHLLSIRNFGFVDISI